MLDTHTHSLTGLLAACKIRCQSAGYIWKRAKLYCPPTSMWSALFFCFFLSFPKLKSKTVIDDTCSGYYECAHVEKYHQTPSNCITVLRIRGKEGKSIEIKVTSHAAKYFSENVPQEQQRSCWLQRNVPRFKPSSAPRPHSCFCFVPRCIRDGRARQVKRSELLSVDLRKQTHRLCKASSNQISA